MDPRTDAGAIALLKVIQGNILKGHGRKHTRLLMFGFLRVARSNRRLFSAARARRPALITSAFEQYEQGLQLPQRTDAEFYSLALTNTGMAACEYRPASEDFPPDYGVEEFRNGVPVPDPAWDSLYRTRPLAIHGVWMLAHETEAGLGAMQDRVTALLAPYGKILGSENGFVWRDPTVADGAPGPVREPFGFRDCLSNPVFLATTSGKIHQPWVQADLNRVIITEKGPHFGGSFLVFSKLDQNVRSFRATEAAMTGLPAGLKDPGALFMGRERDGTPLAKLGAGGLNDFDFDGRPSDARCPFHAHIRKANPRSTHPEVIAANSHNDPRPAQFVRRSVVYDQPSAGGPRQLPAFASPRYPEGDTITGDVGLLFIAYMRDIGEQFNTMRHTWFPDRAFPHPATGSADPLLGAAGAWSWPASNPTVKIAVRPQFVRPRGDLHLYVPPIPWLETQ